MSNNVVKLVQTETLIDLLLGVVDGAKNIEPHEDSEAYELGYQLGFAAGEALMDDALTALKDLKKQQQRLSDLIGYESEPEHF